MAVTTDAANCFLARQPIFDAKRILRGYELLFRSRTDWNHYDAQDPEAATARLITNAILILGFDRVTGGKKAFLNAPREMLVGGSIEALPPKQTVIEILETVSPDAEVVAAVERLWRAGHTFALDDFDDGDRWAPLLPFVDVVKVDVLAQSETETARIARRHAKNGHTLLAEKVETQAVFAACREEGFHLYQGYFFSEPVLLAARDLPPQRMHQIQLLRTLHDEPLNYLRIEEVLKRDVSLSMRLLRYINSAHFGLRESVSSILQALALLGEVEIQRWASLLALVRLAEGTPDHLLVDALERARFCELLARPQAARASPARAFLLGIFATLDALVGRPLPEALDEISAGADIRDALLRRRGELYPILAVARAYERGDWDSFLRACRDARMNPEDVPSIYFEALSWGQEAYRETVRS